MTISCAGSKKLTRGELKVLHACDKAEQVYINYECKTDTVYLIDQTVWTPGLDGWYYRNKIIERKLYRK